MPNEKVVMVSGANRGIGGSIAELLFDSGYRLSLGVRRQAEIERLGRKYGTDRVLIAAYEATDAASPSSWASATFERFGRIDALVNSAGIWRRFNFLEDAEDALDELLLINLKAPMRLMKAAIPYLQQTGSGRVVNLVSLSGLRVAGISAGYAISKFGLLALTYSARLLGQRRTRHRDLPRLRQHRHCVGPRIGRAGGHDAAGGCRRPGQACHRNAEQRLDIYDSSQLRARAVFLMGGRQPPCTVRQIGGRNALVALL